MSTTWKDLLFYKLEDSEEKIELLHQSMIDKENYWNWNTNDMADQVSQISDLIDILNQKIDDVQNQIDQRKIKPGRTEKERIEDYEIKKKITNAIFPYMFVLNNHYRNNEFNN